MKLYLLDANEQIIDAPPTKDVLSLIQDLKLKDTDTIEGALVVSKRYTSIMDNVRYIAVSDRDNDHAFYLYRKTMAEVQDRELIFDGKESFWDDLAGSYIKDKRPGAMLAPDLVKLILDGTRWNVDFVDSGFSETLDTNFYYQSRAEALSSVMSAMTIDVVPMINIEDNTITRRYVNLYLQAGGDNGRRFVYGKNALSVVKKTDDSQVFTALVGRGKSIEETNTDEETGDTSTYNTPRINFADVVWSKANGDPVDKPKGQEYVEWPESTKLYGYSNGNPRIGIVDFDNDDDPAQLLKDTWAQLQTTGVPSVQFGATVGDVGYLDKGETVTIVNYVKGIAYKTRVTELKWNRLAEAKSQLTIGDKLVQNANERMASIATQQSSTAIQAATQTIAKQVANLVTVTNSLGVNVSWSKDGTLPLEPKEGDIVYIHNDDGTITMKSYKDGQWVIIIDDTTGQQAQKKVDEKMVQLNADMEAADANLQAAKQDIDDLQVKLKANDDRQAQLKIDLSDNTELINQVKTDTANSLEKVNNDLTQAQSDAAQAVKNADQAAANAKSSADASGLSATSAQAANDAATAAKNLATEVSNNFATVQSQASTAASDAATALDQAKSALATANGVSDNYKSIKQIVDDTSGTIKTLATSASVDAVSGRVTKAQTLAEQTADGLTFKADSSTVDTLSDAVEQQGIDLKAAQGELKLKLTQSDLTNGLSGYATQTWASQQITASASGLETTLTAVKSTVDNMQVGGRNLIQNSDFSNGLYGWLFAGVSAKPADQLFAQSTGEDLQRFYTSTNPIESIPVGGDYVVSFEAYSMVPGIIVEVGPFDKRQKVTLASASHRYVLYFTRTADIDSTAISFVFANAGDSAHFSHIKMESGNLATAWSPAFEDGIAHTDTAVANLKLTVNGLSTTFAKQSDLQTVSAKTNTTADGLSAIVSVTGSKAEKVTTLIADVKQIQTTMTGDNGVTTRLQTLEGFRQTATSQLDGKASKSEVTQLSNQYTSVVKSIADISVGGTNLLANSDFSLGMDGWTSDGVNASSFKEADGTPSAFITSLGTTMQRMYDAESCLTSIPIGATFIVSFSAYTAKAGSTLTVGPWNNHQQVKLNQVMTRYSFKFVKDSSTAGSLSIGLSNSGETAHVAYVKVEVGTLPTAWSPSPNDDRSQITQLKGLIDQRVMVDGKIAAALSLSADGGGTVTIQGASLYVTAASHFDAASIQSAAIANLDAEKITSGSISSDRLATTKLNADNITSGSIAAERLAATKISATNIVGGTFDAGTMTVKNLSADMIASGTIDASLLSTTKLNATNITSGTLDVGNLEVKNLNASLIVGGELDASTMNVINLNGASITTGTITADKMATNALLVGLNNALSQVNITPTSIEIARSDVNLTSISLNSSDGILFSKGANDIAGMHAGYTGTGLSGQLVLDTYIKPAATGQRWGRIISNTSSDIWMSYFWDEATANKQDQPAGLNIDTDVIFRGNLYSKSAITSNDPHLHLSTMTQASGTHGIALLNDNNTGIEIDNDNNIYWVRNNVRTKVSF